MKKTLMYFIIFIIVFDLSSVAKADEMELDKINSKNSVLVLFSSENEKVDKHQRLLDLSLGHFSENITFKNVKDAKQKDFKEKTHVIYYGQVKEKLLPEVVDFISSFNGPVMSIGHNVEQLKDRYDFLKINGEKNITKLEYVGAEKKTKDIDPITIIETTIDDDVEVLVRGINKREKMPMIMHKEETYYFASHIINQPNSVYFSQVLNSFFNKKTIDKTPAYIRLEDVHPLTDPKNLMNIAKELKERNIPYMVAVIPTYIDPKTGKEYHFQDRPEVLKILKYMQKNGGSMVLHGYTHQFRKSETGEGFEFWDAKNQSPIYHEADEDVIKVEKEDFGNVDEYESLISLNKAFEREYIEKRLTKGVQELANYGIYPLAFEAPHYAMSQNGYKVTSEFFSTYVGQIQLSDEKWEIMDTTPYASKPSFLHGMLLLPETIGYVEPEKREAVNQMVQKAEYYQVTEGGIIGGFYHPYLGMKNFIELIEKMEAIPDIEWIDLKKIDNTVAVEHVYINSENGKIDVDIDYARLITTSSDYFIYHIKKNIEYIVKLIAIVSILGIIIFAFCIIFQLVKKKK